MLQRLLSFLVVGVAVVSSLGLLFRNPPWYVALLIVLGLGIIFVSVLRALADRIGPWR